jgi:hypothetical protein
MKSCLVVNADPRREFGVAAHVATQLIQKAAARLSGLSPQKANERPLDVHRRGIADHQF